MSTCFRVISLRSMKYSISIRIRYYLIDGTPIDRVEEMRDLGVTFDCKFKFDRHILNIPKAAYGRLGFVLRSKSFKNAKWLKFLYVFSIGQKWTRVRMSSVETVYWLSGKWRWREFRGSSQSICFSDRIFKQLTMSSV